MGNRTVPGGDLSIGDEAAYYTGDLLNGSQVAAANINWVIQLLL